MFILFVALKEDFFKAAFNRFTSADGRLMAPLAIRKTLGLRRSFQHVAVIADEADHVVQVEPVAHRTSVYRASRVPAADRCQEAQCENALQFNTI